MAAQNDSDGGWGGGSLTRCIAAPVVLNAIATLLAVTMAPAKGPAAVLFAVQLEMACWTKARAWLQG